MIILVDPSLTNQLEPNSYGIIELILPHLVLWLTTTSL